MLQLSAFKFVNCTKQEALEFVTRRFLVISKSRKLVRSDKLSSDTCRTHLSFNEVKFGKLAKILSPLCFLSCTILRVSMFVKTGRLLMFSMRLNSSFLRFVRCPNKSKSRAHWARPSAVSCVKTFKL